jgi:hypothetical protein
VRGIACVASFMIYPALLAAGTQQQQLHQSVLQLQSLQQSMRPKLQQMRQGLDPKGEARARRQLSGDLRSLQAKVLKLREAALKNRVSVAPPSWGNLPANAGIDALTMQIEGTVDYLIMLAMKLQQEASDDPVLVPMTLDTVTVVRRLDTASNTTAEAKKPDLIVCLTWDGTFPTIYMNKKITVQVQNVGEAPAPPSILRVYVKQNGVQHVQVPALNPHRMFMWSKEYNWDTCGSKVVKARADDGNRVPEIHENNNEMEWSTAVWCGPLTTQVQPLPQGCSTKSKP